MKRIKLDIINSDETNKIRYNKFGYNWSKLNHLILNPKRINSDLNLNVENWFQSLYWTSSTSQADHFDLKLNNAIVIFVAECKKKNSVQLCVYSEKKVKQKEVLYGSSVINVEEDTLVCLKLLIISYWIMLLPVKIILLNLN